MGMTPYYTSQSPSIAARATYLSSYMNQKLVASLPKDVLYFDTYTLYRQMAAHPAAFGLTNVVDQCYNNGVVCSHPEQYLSYTQPHTSNLLWGLNTCSPRPGSINIELNSKKLSRDEANGTPEVSVERHAQRRFLFWTNGGITFDAPSIQKMDVDVRGTRSIGKQNPYQ
jgi:hypothetical protein